MRVPGTKLLVVGLAGALVLGCSSGSSAQIRVSPGPVERAGTVVVDGLAPGAAVTLRTTVRDAKDRPWTSVGELTADASGRVDTARTPSSGGTWTGVDVTAPYRSMQPPPGVAAAPYPFLGSSAGVEVEALVADDVVRARMERPLGDPGAALEATPVADGGLVGDLYVPRGMAGPLPGVLLLGGSEGGRPDPAYARLLASHGYVVLGLAYFDEPGVPAQLSAIPVEYGLAGADWLAARPEVGGRPIAVHGTSKGAEYALLLASSAPQRFGAVVAVVGTDVVWSALAFGPGPGRSSWTRDGVDVPFVPPRMVPFDPPGAGGALRVAGSYGGWYAAATPDEREAARIPAERIAAPVLAISAGDDGIWPSSAQTDRLCAALRAGTCRDHPRAGHFVGGVPHLPTTRTAIPAGPILLESDGEATATARAQAQSFDDVLALFRGL